jgi:mannose-6-phosphate isomerase-like protein (cupin superfamily)
MYLLVLFIIVIIYIVHGANPKEFHVPNCCTKFDINKMNEKLGTTVLKIERYFENGEPGLYANSADSTTLNSWVTSTASKRGWMSKLKFIPGKNFLGDYILKWFMKQELPEDLEKRIFSNETREYGIRITSGSWHFPKHFDASDNYLVILSGQRHVTIDGDRNYILKTGDIFYIPSGLYHEIKCEGVDDQLNILFNICFTINNIAKKIN